MAITLPLLAGGQATNQGKTAGQNFIKGLSDLKTAKVNRQATRTNIEAAEVQTDINKILLEKKKKDRDSGLTDLQRTAAMAKAEAEVPVQAVNQVVAEAKLAAFQENPEAAKALFSTDLMSKVTENMLKVDEKQSEYFFNQFQKVSSGVATWDEFNESLKMMPGLSESINLPEDPEEGLAAATLYTSILPYTMKYQREAALKQVAASQQQDSTEYIAGQVLLSSTGENVAARQVKTGPNAGEIQVQRNGKWVSIETGEGRFTKIGTGNKVSDASAESFVKLVGSADYVTARNETSRTIDHAKTAIQLSQDIISGVGTSTVTDIRSLIRTTASMLGVEDQIANIGDIEGEEQMRSIGTWLVREAISQQGKSFSDADLRNEQRALPDLKNTPETNRHIANVILLGALNKDEYMAMEGEIASSVALGNRTLHHERRTRFNQYMKDFPRSKLVDGKFTVIEDDANLYRYYARGIPKKWTISTADNTFEYTQEELEHFAKQKGMTTREAVAELERNGAIEGVKY